MNLSMKLRFASRVIVLISLMFLTGIALAQDTESLVIDEEGNTDLNGNLTVKGNTIANGDLSVTGEIKTNRPYAFGGWPNCYPYITGMSRFLSDTRNYCWGYLPTETASNGVSCGDNIDTDFFGSYNLSFLGKDLLVNHSFNSTVYKYGYAEMFFMENSGSAISAKLPIGSCNDVAIFTGIGPVNRGDGGTWSMIYHRMPSPGDGTSKCEYPIDPVLTVPAGKFRLVVITRGKAATGYLTIKPFNWKNDLKLDWEGFRRYTGQY